MDLSVSILSSNFIDLKKNIRKLEESGADYIHLDIMDGNYVPNITFGWSIIRNIKEITSIPLDVHLMINQPEKYVKKFAEAGADIITIHPESTVHLHRSIQEIKKHGVKVGISLNPATPIETLNYVIDEIDLILLMSVNPGFGGQTFIPRIKTKIKEVRNMIDKNNLDIILEVDGGVKLSNARELKEAGANLIVVGSDIFDGDIKDRVRKFKKI